jgi:hypothetical protein
LADEDFVKTMFAVWIIIGYTAFDRVSPRLFERDAGFSGEGFLTSRNWQCY